ncbi:MAG: hypothetical protein HPY82_18855 [Gammaproteobacteria bacterium]|nr:hypothetical protein [Gammaproteobacteria bacterium]
MNNNIGPVDVSYLIVPICVFIFPIIIGILFSRFEKPVIAYAASVSIPWLLFLGFNVLSEMYSPDSDLVRGMWLPMQLTVGSIVSIFGVGACWFFRRQRQKDA